MTLVPWQPEPAPFGNAKGFDYVALDVKARIAHRFGATIMRGRLPADIAAEQPTRLEAAKAHYGERHTDHSADQPFAVFTISQDGLAFSGEHADGRGHTSGYRGHYWLDRIGPDTIVFDLRTIPDADIVRYAVRGPMLDVSLPEGTVSTMDPIPAHMAGVAEDYMRHAGTSLAATGAEVEGEPC